jgi:transposase
MKILHEPFVFVGLDVHQDSIQLCIINAAGKVLLNQRIANAVTPLVSIIRRFGVQARIGLEACGGAACLADALIQVTGWSVQLTHAGYVQRMRQNPDKSDYSDAYLLADLVRVGYLPRVWLAPPALRDLRHLVHYRQQLVDQNRKVKLRIRALLREHRIRAPKHLWSGIGRQWLLSETILPTQARWVLERHVEELDRLSKALAAIGNRLGEIAEKDTVMLQLMDHRGIGLVTAVVFRAQVGDVGRFASGKQLARFCGLSPCNASSGSRQGDAGLVRGCNKLLRATLIEAAHRLSVQDSRWKTFKQHMRERGKPGSLIAAAIANRWVRRLYHDLMAERHVTLVVA